MVENIIRDFLKGEENSEIYVNKLVYENVSKIVKIDKNSIEYELLENIIYIALEGRITYLCKYYEEYVLECEVNGITRILDKKSYLEEHISEIIIYIMYGITQYVYK